MNDIEKLVAILKGQPPEVTKRIIAFAEGMALQAKLDNKTA